MDKNRKNKENKAVRKHISAARDWLGRAESSMDKENSLRGDLDVMLAQAELQRAQETKFGHGWRKWLIRLAPLIIALVVGVGYLALLHTKQVIEVPTNMTTVKDSDDSSTGLEKTQVVKVQPSFEDHEGAAPNAAGNGASGFVRQNPPTVEVVPQLPQQEVSPARTESQVPDAEMQQLMQAAGKTLRE
ncbi:hypothetical protein [Anaerovibrio lipolyticus]|uniref:hypothetical protein n=1 Tax=Anaerovibrio lipolyticus TaxID=82374 RepID=UPI000686CDFC|nr:hypothetical protein [Anaerovibrio lipolyticus]